MIIVSYFSDFGCKDTANFRIKRKEYQQKLELFDSFENSYYICSMKYKVIITLLFCMFVGNVGNAQSFRDNNNMLVGKVESDGTIRNANNMRIGRIFDDGTIRDKNNMRLGTVSSDGTVRDNNNMRLGTIDKDGTVRNSNNMRIGTASGINTRYAAVFFFFNLF